MDTLPFDPVELVAVDATRNIHRRWRMAAFRDLFGAVIVETGWGRIGTPGRRLVRSFTDDAEALRYVRALLARRGTAPRRLGVGYRCTGQVVMPPACRSSGDRGPGCRPAAVRPCAIPTPQGNGRDG